MHKNESKFNKYYFMNVQLQPSNRKAFILKTKTFECNFNILYIYFKNSYLIFRK